MIADELSEQGNRETASELTGYLRSMQGHVERELVRARSAVVNANAPAEPMLSIVKALVRSMQRLPRGSELEWQIDVADRLYVKFDKAALAEVLGNLLDNARKWARSQVRVRAVIEENALIIEVTDDGPGVPEAEHGNVLARGRRLDETVPGSGFGLAIAAEYVEQHGARLELLKAKGGGLRARIALPQARFQIGR